jgi:hypothetical protein
MHEMDSSTAPIQANDSPTESNWLDCLKAPSKSNVQFLEAKQKRDEQVGELLREMHYLATSEKPWGMELSRSEEDYWTGCARMAPGFELTRIQAELSRRKAASSTAAI